MARKLFEAVSVGPTQLDHRVVMAPLTRMRSDPGDVPNDLMLRYYDQRASKGGLIIAEAATVSTRGRAYLGAPGIYNDEQVAAWRKITAAVHAKGGKIFLQLWHGGRQSHSDNEPNKEPPIAPSALLVEGYAHTPDGWKAIDMPRALEIEEIPAVIEEFQSGAARAMAAGFDGVEIHAANGYLPDQFLQDSSNVRTDAYGGPIQARARFLLEVTKAVIDVWGADRVGVRISPDSKFNAMADSDPTATFSYLVKALDALDLGFLHVIEPRMAGDTPLDETAEPVAAATLRKLFKRTIIAAGGFNPDSAEAILASGAADLVAFGRSFIANPDLPKRFRDGLALNPYDRDSFYGGDARGYVDYPFHDAKAPEPVA
uniref:NADH:flavin oxidoreductase/NADH oxidase n=1 Tax=Caulobacter sp. (strain K31) TaxID=366602 RepID=B0T973_CAUSK